MRILVIAAVLLLATPTQATTAGEMVENCEYFLDTKLGNSGDMLAAIKAGHCAGSFEALSHMIWLMEGKMRLWDICLPANGTHGQYMKIFLRHMQTNPKYLHNDWLFPALNSLRQAFPGPCKQG